MKNSHLNAFVAVLLLLVGEDLHVLAAIVGRNQTGGAATKPLLGKRHYVVGVLANRGAEQAFVQFNQTFNEYLTEQVGIRFEPRVSFSMVAVDFNSIRQTVQDRIVDLICVNPAAFSCIDGEFGAASLATLQREVSIQGQTHVIDAFGGVIIARSDRDDITSVADVRGKSFAAASILGLGSGQAQFFELFKRGISFVHDVKQAIFTSNQNDVVKHVQNGEADFGFVRENQIQKMVDKGAARKQDFKVIEGRWHDYKASVFPFSLTTELFPEWNLAALSSVNDDVKAEIQLALLGMEPGHPASAGRYHSWAPSASYMLLRNMQQSLGYIRQSAVSGGLECVSGGGIYDAVVCPPGTYRDTKAKVLQGCERAGLGCPAGSECLCNPCRQGHEIDIFPQSKDAISATFHCERMETCDKVEQGHGTVWILQDNLQRGGQLAVEVIFREPLDAQGEGRRGAVTLAAQPSPTTPFQYLLQIPGRASTGLHVLEFRIEGKHIEDSPLFLSILSRDCERDFPGAQRTASEDGECVCAPTTFPIGEECVAMRLLPVMVGGPLLLALLLVVCYVWRTRHLSADAEESDVSRRIVVLRKMLWIQKKDGFRIDGEWSFRQTTHIKTRMLANLARLTLLLDFDARQVDMLIAVLRFWGDSQASEPGTESRASSRGSSSNLDHEKQQYLGVRHLLLEVSKRILDPAVADDPAGKDERAFTWASTLSASERFTFFQQKIAKLKIWEEGQNFLFLKGVVQFFMDDLRKSCDDLYRTITMEDGGRELVAVEVPDSDIVWRQDHPAVQAIPVVESLTREVQLHRLASNSQTDLRRASFVHSSQAGSQISVARRRAPFSARAVLEAWVRRSSLAMDPLDDILVKARGEECVSVSAEVDLEHNFKGLEGAGGAAGRSRSVGACEEDSTSRQGDGWLRARSHGHAKEEGTARQKVLAGGKGMGFLLRSKVDHGHRRMEWLRSLHAELKESAQGRACGVDVGEIRNEEPFVAHLANRAELLNAAFQQQVRWILSEEGPFALSGTTLPQIVPGPVKTKERMMEKVATYAEELDAEEQLPMAAMILDPVRVSLVCQSTRQVLQCTRWLLAHGDEHNLSVVRLKNKFSNQDSTEYDGYRDIMLCVLFKGSFGLNIIGEIQIQDSRMHALKVKMHRLYKVKRATAADKI